MCYEFLLPFEKGLKDLVYGYKPKLFAPEL